MMMRGGDRNSGRKLEVTAQAGVVVLVLMVMRGSTGAGGTARAGARGIRERRTGGEGECMKKGEMRWDCVRMGVRG